MAKMVAKRRPKLTLNTAIVRKNSMNLKINPNLNSAVSLARDERINSSRNILTVLEGGKTYTKPIKILPNLYLGSCDATKDLTTLLDKDITTILNLAGEVEKPNWFNNDHWMDLSNNHWVTKITQNQLEIMSNLSDSTKVNSPPSPPPSEDEDTKKGNTSSLTIPSQEQNTIFPLSPLPQKTFPALHGLYSPQETIPSTPLSPKSPTTPTSISPSSQHTLVLSPIETSFADSVSSSNTLNTPFVDTYSYNLPPETPFLDTISTPYPPETPYVDTLQTTLSTLPETPYVDTFSTPLDRSPKQLPPETPYVDTYSSPINTSPRQLPPETPYFDTYNSSALPIPETPYVDAFTSQQQQQKYLAKLINHSHKSLNDSDLLQAISLSSASTPPSATINFNSCLTSKKIQESSNLSMESAHPKIADNKELEIHYYHQCWNHNQRNTQEKLIEAFNIIDSTRLEDQHSILVSCQQGVSRSATLVIAYVMKTKQWGLMKSYNFVKEKCPWIAPNITLMNELSEFEQHLLQQTQK